MHDFLFELNGDSEIPFYQQLIDRLQEGIASGSIVPGQPLPSTRDLSKMSGVSRDTVVRAYETLQNQGWVATAHGKAPIALEREQDGSVARRLPVLPLRVDTSAYYAQLDNSEPVKIIAAFSSNAPADNDLPRAEWKRCFMPHFDLDSPASLDERHPFGHVMLRSAIVRYVKRLHHVICDEEDVAIVVEPRHAIYTIARILVDPGDFVVMENPSGRWVRRMFRAHGAEIVPIPIDEDGLCIDKLELIEQPIKLVFVTPSHHDPTGAVMSLDRRRALLNWAKERRVMIVEDNSDCQFRYSSAALPALQALDTDQSVIYVSSFWKVLYPLAPQGFVVFPKSMTQMGEKALSVATNDSVVRTNQCALADFINDGHLDTHVRKMTKVYLERRKALFDRMTHCFGSRVHLAKESASLLHHIKLDLELSDDQILECAEDVNFKLITLAPFYFDGNPEGNFLIPFGSIQAADLDQKIQQFADRVNALVYQS